MVEVMKIMATSCKSPMHALLHSVSPTLQQATADPCLWPETPGHSRASLGLILVGPLLLSRGFWCPPGSVCALQESVPPVLCKFWWLYGGVNGDLLQEGLCHNPGLLHPEPRPCSSPLLTRTSVGDTQTQFWLSLCWVSCFLVHTRFEPSKHLWWVWGLILNAISPFLLSCWGFSFALGRGLSPQSRSKYSGLDNKLLHSSIQFTRN